MTSAEYFICNAWKELHTVVMVELEETLCVKTEEVEVGAVQND
jgi:hypothetical protein